MRRESLRPSFSATTPMLSYVQAGGGCRGGGGMSQTWALEQRSWRGAYTRIAALAFVVWAV
jgi:hypothetical protein